MNALFDKVRELAERWPDDENHEPTTAKLDDLLRTTRDIVDMAKALPKVDWREYPINWARPCKTCKKWIIGVQTQANETMPVDIDTGETHFATCTKPARHRRRDRERAGSPS